MTTRTNMITKANTRRCTYNDVSLCIITITGPAMYSMADKQAAVLDAETALYYASTSHPDRVEFEVFTSREEADRRGIAYDVI